jgi:hypothetical protein
VRSECSRGRAKRDVKEALDLYIAEGGTKRRLYTPYFDGSSTEMSNGESALRDRGNTALLVSDPTSFKIDEWFPPIGSGIH